MNCLLSVDSIHLKSIKNIGLHNSYCLLRDEGPETFYTGNYRNFNKRF